MEWKDNCLWNGTEQMAFMWRDAGVWCWVSKEDHVGGCDPCLEKAKLAAEKSLKSTLCQR